jgi:mersacidin/lichenicidin family type 2 lantibiotic
MKLDVIRAWKDETYRQSLSYEQLNALPENPAGELELTDADLQGVSGRGGFEGGFPGGEAGGFPGGGVGGLGAFGASGGFFGGEVEHNFINSAAVVCENAIFSNTNVRNVFRSSVRVTNICVNFN